MACNISRRYIGWRPCGKVRLVPLRPKTLELAILGRLMQGPCHGYVLRKHLVAVVGALHSVSYGSLYPALRRLTERGLICDCGAGLARFVGGRSRRVYHITELGQDYFHYDAALHSLSGERSGVRYRLGDRVRVKVMRVDLESSKIDFALENPVAAAPDAARGKQRRK